LFLIYNPNLSGVDKGVLQMQTSALFGAN